MVKERLEELSETRVQVLQVFRTDKRQITDRHADRYAERQTNRQTCAITGKRQVRDMLKDRLADRQTC